MLSKNQVKFIRGLKKKKIRQTKQLFLAEGIKVVEEILQSSIKLHELYATPDYKNPLQVKNYQLIEEKELAQISEFNNPNQVLGVFEIPKVSKPIRKGLTLLLDEINDPGNLGTIIRLCDWFGIRQLVCSSNTVDCFNQKVVQASMGSLARVEIIYVDPIWYLREEKRPVYGAFLYGDNVYQNRLPQEAVLVLGNEANGISEEVGNLVTDKITIPQFGEMVQTESLNVAMATAILLSEFRR